MDKVTITEAFYDITISDWLSEYKVIVSSYPVSDKTLANRMCNFISKLGAIAYFYLKEP